MCLLSRDKQKSAVLKDPQPLPLYGMVSFLRSVIGSFPDKRTGKNSSYSIRDAGLGAFSVFFTQSPSFLSFQRSMEKNICLLFY
jgi:hypothetical protein